MKSYCMCCNRELNDTKIVLLEYDRRDNTYHNFNDVPEEHSQGWFEFGPGCARKKLAKAKIARRGQSSRLPDASQA